MDHRKCCQLSSTDDRRQFMTHWASTFVYNTAAVTQRVARVSLRQLGLVSSCAGRRRRKLLFPTIADCIFQCFQTCFNQSTFPKPFYRRHIAAIDYLFVNNSYYLRQGRYVIVVVCFSVCLSVCLLATLRKNCRTDLHDIFREGWQWAIEQMIKFWWRSGSRIRIATLVRRPWRRYALSQRF